MAVFLIVSTMPQSTASLEAKIGSVIQESDKLKLAPDTWLVEFPGTSADLGEKLDLRGQQTEIGIVFLVSNYTGRANPDIWEWLRNHPDARSL